MRWKIAILGILLGTIACHQREAKPAPPGTATNTSYINPTDAGNESPKPVDAETPADVWILVDGMTKVQGIT